MFDVRAWRIAQGHCPGCDRKVVGYKAPQGSFAPEAWAYLSERGIDPATGHNKDCSVHANSKEKQ